MLMAECGKNNNSFVLGPLLVFLIIPDTQIPSPLPCKSLYWRNHAKTSTATSKNWVGSFASVVEGSCYFGSEVSIISHSLFEIFQWRPAALVTAFETWVLRSLTFPLKTLSRRIFALASHSSWSC